MKFEIIQTVSGASLGVYEGETGENAIRAMLADAGEDGSPDAGLVARPVITEDATASYGFEGLVDGQWSAEACGVQDRSNYFRTREAAEAEIPRLARVLKCDPSKIRVVEVS